MERLRFDAFLDSLVDNEDQGINLIALEMMDSFPGDEFLDGSESHEVKAIAQSYERFIQESSEKSRTFAYWSMYIKMTGMLHTLYILFLVWGQY